MTVYNPCFASDGSYMRCLKLLTKGMQIGAISFVCCNLQFA
jgi:hypothetical protein